MTEHDDEAAFAGPGALAARIRGRELSPRELIAFFLHRIEALDPQLNAFRVVRGEEALAEAEALGADPALGDRPLAGVPFAVKDDAPLAGQATTRGSRSPAPVAGEDSELVATLRAAGAIPIGVTNVPELMIFPWTASAANGITRNPWDPSRTPGGSSGGSAAAVAAGLVPFATAADGGGSIRIPAAATGLPGLKRGRGPQDAGWNGLAVDGILARSVADTALLYGVTHGLRAPDGPPSPLRIAVARRPPPGVVAPLSADQRGALQATARLLESLGHHLVRRAPAYRTIQVQFLQLWLRGVYEESLTLADRSLMERTTRGIADGGRYGVPPWRRDRVLGARPATTARVLALWEEIDVLMTPALARTAIAAEGGYGRPAAVAVDIAGRFTPYTSAFNLTGQPAMAVPAGIGADGLPLAVQLVGRPGSESLLLALAAQLEAAAPIGARPSVGSVTDSVAGDGRDGYSDVP